MTLKQVRRATFIGLILTSATPGGTDHIFAPMVLQSVRMTAPFTMLTLSEEQFGLLTSIRTVQYPTAGNLQDWIQKKKDFRMASQLTMKTGSGLHTGEARVSPVSVHKESVLVSLNFPFRKLPAVLLEVRI